MTRIAKAQLILYAKLGWTFSQIKKEIFCSDATIIKYMKIFNPKK